MLLSSHSLRHFITRSFSYWDHQRIHAIHNFPFFYLFFIYNFLFSVPEPSLLEEVKSHLISPREFRHIRCTRVDDGHQSELCGTLRTYVSPTLK